MHSNSAWLTVGRPHFGQCERGEEHSTSISPEIPAVVVIFSNVKTRPGQILTHLPHPLQDRPERSRTVSAESSWIVKTWRGQTCTQKPHRMQSPIFCRTGEHKPVGAA
jgi:hypothetical protein